MKDILSNKLHVLRLYAQSCRNFLFRKPVEVKMVCWIPPIAHLKLNTDGCSKGNPGAFASGGVLRNQKGRFILAFACNFGVCTSLQSEVKALLVGIHLCTDRGSFGFQIEIDSQILVNILQGRFACPWRVQQEVDTLRNLFASCFSIQHCYRKANRVVDLL